MKRMRIVIACIVLSCCLAMPAAAIEYGPFIMNDSNELPDGHAYAKVYIDDQNPYCDEGQQEALVTVWPNEDILLPGDNYGIQAFGLNYQYSDPENLHVTVVGDDKNKWRIDFDNNSSMGPFGIFAVNTSGTGATRQNPLKLSICYSGTNELSNWSFYQCNAQNYAFACHIADFSFDLESGYEDLSSAWFGLRYDATLVDLAWFDAVQIGRRALVAWETKTETDNQGFNLYRKTGEDGLFARINATLIPAEGGAASGARYFYVDTGLRPGTTYYYRLVDVETDDAGGDATSHPSVTAGRGLGALMRMLMRR